jgi:hypothetical protein
MKTSPKRIGHTCKYYVTAFTTLEPPEATNWAFPRRIAYVLRVQPLPAGELHGVGADDASKRLTREEPLKDVEGDVPARGAPRDEAAIDVVPQREARAATRGLEFPPDIAVLQQLGSIRSRHFCFQRRGRSHPGELHRSNRTHAPIDDEWSPLAQMRRVGKRLPDFFRRVAQFSDEDERPLLFTILSPSFRTCAALAGPGVYCSRSVIFFSLSYQRINCVT